MHHKRTPTVIIGNCFDRKGKEAEEIGLCQFLLPRHTWQAEHAAFSCNSKRFSCVSASFKFFILKFCKICLEIMMKLNIFLLTIVCFAPLGNIVFDYCLLSKAPTILHIIVTVVALVLYFPILISMRKLMK